MDTWKLLPVRPVTRKGRVARTKEDGQALVLVTVALVAMFGLLGLAIDLGWEFYVHKTARAAADSAALSAVREARASVQGTVGPYNCMTAGFTCSPLISCSAASGNLKVGCDFAAANAFPDGGLGGRETVRIEANVPDSACGTVSPPTCVPTAPGVAALYWVHVIATETVPQIFSGILGNTSGTVSADATAALVNVVVLGSLIVLNREYDQNPPPPNGKPGIGTDIYAQGGGSLTADGGILLASNKLLTGDASNGISLIAPFTYIRSPGTASWFPCQNCRYDLPDSAFFQDPERGKGQPPLDPGQASKPYIAVPCNKLGTICTLTAAQCPNNICPSGNYYTTWVNANNQTVANGQQITVDSGIQFDDGPFGNFLFFGGVHFGGNTTLGPGRYVLAGVLPSTLHLMDTENAVITSSSTADAGRIFILTNSSYGGDETMANVVAGIPVTKAQGVWPLGFGDTFLKSGNGSYAFYGLNASSTALPANLRDFASIVMWQDQHNSTVLYDSNGYVRNSTVCLGGGSINPDLACPNTEQNNPMLTIWGGQSFETTTINGIVYQPRGAWVLVHSGTNFNGSIALITGSLVMQGGPTLSLAGEGIHITSLTSTLVH